jgi:hypothetical protein
MSLPHEVNIGLAVSRGYLAQYDFWCPDVAAECELHFTLIGAAEVSCHSPAPARKSV